MVSDAMTMYKAFNKSPDGGTDSSTGSREANLNLE